MWLIVGKYTCITYLYDLYVDVDECAVSGQVCAQTAHCENTYGSYRCVCKEGFEQEPDSQSCRGDNVVLSSALPNVVTWPQVRLWLCGRVPDLQSGGCSFESRPELFRTNVSSALHPSGVGKWVPAIAGKAKAGMAHTDCGWTCVGVQAKLWDPFENTCHTRSLLRWWFITERRYTNCMHLYALPLPLQSN